jgi:hypothetical protein
MEGSQSYAVGVKESHSRGRRFAGSAGLCPIKMMGFRGEKSEDKTRDKTAPAD